MRSAHPELLENQVQSTQKRTATSANTTNEIIDLESTELPSTSQSQPAEKKRKTITDYYNQTGQETIEECVSCLAIDFVSINFITNNPFIRSSFRAKGMKLPKNPSDVMNLVHKDATNKRNETKKILKKLILEEKRFSLMIDEWSSIRRRRYFNITLIEAESGLEFNLGLVRIFGSFTAEACAAQVKIHLDKFGLVLRTHIVATVNDGASVMKKYGRIIDISMQLCLNHGIHLAVEDVIYKKSRNAVVVVEDEEIDDTSDQDDDFDGGDGLIVRSHENVPSFIDELERVREVIRYIRGSQLRNEFFIAKSGLELKLDVKNRWNSVPEMLTSVIRSQDAIYDTLSEYNSLHLLEGIDFEHLSVLYNILEPIKLTVEALSRSDCNLEKAQKAVEFMFKKLRSIQTVSRSPFAEKMINRLETRMDERENSEILLLLECLRDRSKKPNRATLDLAQKLLRRLYPADDEQSSIDENSQCFEGSQLDDDIEMTMTDELNSALQSAGVDKSAPTHNYNTLESEFRLFRANGQRTEHLQRLLSALLTIKPASTDIERVFSAAALVVTKIRSRLSDKSLDDLIFLRYFYKNLTGRWNHKV